MLQRVARIACHLIITGLNMEKDTAREEEETSLSSICGRRTPASYFFFSFYFTINIYLRLILKFTYVIIFSHF